MVAHRYTVVAVLVVGLFGGPAGADDASSTAGFDRDAALEHSRAAIGRQLADFTFRDIYGEPVHLADFRGKPVLVSLIYTSCAHYCPITTQTLAAGVEAAQGAIGQDGFTVLTIGFDVRNDRPSRMRSYQRTQGIDLPNWHFLSADTETILALTEQVGFSYYTSSQGFDHLAQTTLLDGNGKIVRQLYGTELTVPQVVEPLKRLRAGETPALSSFDNFVERIRLFCTLYDPDRDAYRFDWSIFVGIGVGMLSIGLLGAFFIDQLLLHLKARG
jgi:protein SCO1/2